MIILYMIDAFTRFVQSCVIKSKSPAWVVIAILKFWFGVFGAPGCLFFDGGGEFTAKEVEDMAEQLGVEIKTTAAYAPWMNGINERNHA